MAYEYPNLNLPGQRLVSRDAAVWRRCSAFAIDLLVLDLFVFAPFAAFLHGVTFTITRELYALVVAAALLALMYFALFEYVAGQTPGMMLLRIRAQGVTLWRAFVRNAYFIPVAPFPVLLFTEPIYLLLRRTRLLEQLSQTRTIEEVAV